MRLTSILKFLFLIPGLVTSQAIAADADTLFSPAVRLGIDVSGLARHLFEPETLSMEYTIDLEWRQDLFVSLEAGHLTVDIEKSTHRYQANGVFFRLGPDFNVSGRKDPSSNDLVLLSIRYGFGQLSHEASDIIVSNPYWGDYHTTIPRTDFSAHWLEAGLGLKTEIWSGLFLSWSIRGRLLLTKSSGTELTPYLISGYGNADSYTSLMLHYSISYRLPLR